MLKVAIRQQRYVIKEESGSKTQRIIADRQRTFSQSPAQESEDDIVRMQNLSDKIQKKIEETKETKEGQKPGFKPRLKLRRKELKQDEKYKELINCINEIL